MIRSILDGWMLHLWRVPTSWAVKWLRLWVSFKVRRSNHNWKLWGNYNHSFGIRTSWQISGFFQFRARSHDSEILSQRPGLGEIFGNSNCKRVRLRPHQTLVRPRATQNAPRIKLGLRSFPKHRRREPNILVRCWVCWGLHGWCPPEECVFVLLGHNAWVSLVCKAMEHGCAAK